MPVLSLNKPVEQRDPVLVVQNRFEPGVHRFALVVVDDRGNESEPDVIAVTLRRALVVDPVRPPVNPVINPVVNPVVNPVINPVINPVVRPRGAARKGKNHGPR